MGNIITGLNFFLVSFVCIFLKVFLCLFYLPLMRFKIQLKVVLKDNHYPKPRG